MRSRGRSRNNAADAVGVHRKNSTSSRAACSSSTDTPLVPPAAPLSSWASSCAAASLFPITSICSSYSLFARARSSTCFFIRRIARAASVSCACSCNGARLRQGCHATAWMAVRHGRPMATRHEMAAATAPAPSG